jgi:hypothetical protein
MTTNTRTKGFPLDWENMDPNAALGAARDYALALIERDIPDDDAIGLAETFQTLDEWLRRGGFLPDDWWLRRGGFMPDD